MKVLLCGSYSPKGLLPSYEGAFKKMGMEITYAGLPYRFERAGYASDLDLQEIGPRGSWDLLVYIDEWKPVFPLGLPEGPFPTVGYFPDAALDIPRGKVMVPFFDYVFLAHNWLVDLFREVNPNTFYLPFAYDPERVPYQPGEFLYDVAFIGAVRTERKALLERIAREFRTNDYWKRADPNEIGHIYSRAKIVFDKPTPKSFSHTMRAFEAMGCGSLLLTEKLPRDPLFAPGKHLLTYRNEGDLMDLIRYYLAHEEERARIARRGQELVRSQHTYLHRVRTILEILARSGFRKTAPIRGMKADQVFLLYQKVFSQMMMLDGMAHLLADGKVSVGTRIQALPLVAKAIYWRLRRMGWRRFLSSTHG